MSLGADWAARLLTLLQPIIMVGGKKKNDFVKKCESWYHFWKENTIRVLVGNLLEGVGGRDHDRPYELYNKQNTV